ncbi:MAG: MmcQ/YjbR family DNA-binding protein [Dactylosporangium sp.]|nr:MmcQ/YjbR family DNA-binding protein [Dactylosporangium sp.]NNJ63773.1 MmcQ/YjbR family DNA-binding protein [Dactylosporangium sp.]
MADTADPAASAGDVRTGVERRCLELPGATLDHPFGETPVVYKIGGRMFALVNPERVPPWLSLKLAPEFGLELRAQYPAQVLPGYHLNKTHWNTFVLDGALDLREILDCVEQSYTLVRARLPGRVRTELPAYFPAGPPLAGAPRSPSGEPQRRSIAPGSGNRREHVGRLGPWKF